MAQSWGADTEQPSGSLNGSEGLIKPWPSPSWAVSSSSPPLALYVLVLWLKLQHHPRVDSPSSCLEHSTFCPDGSGHGRRTERTVTFWQRTAPSQVCGRGAGTPQNDGRSVWKRALSSEDCFCNWNELGTSAVQFPVNTERMVFMMQIQVSPLYPQIREPQF